MERTRLYLAKAVLVGIIALSSLVAAAVAVFAYPGVPSAGNPVSVTCGGTAAPGTSCTITVKFVDSSGNPIVNASVTWTVSVPPGGSFLQNPTVTGLDGTTSVSFIAPTLTGRAPGEAILAREVIGGDQLAALPGACGPGTVTGTTGGVSVSTPINVPCPAGTSATNNGLLPTTSTTDPGASSTGRWLLAGGAAIGLLAAVGAAIRLRRSRRFTSSPSL